MNGTSEFLDHHRPYVSRANHSKYFSIHLNECPHPSCLELKLDNVLPRSNRDMVQTVILWTSWPWKVKVIGKNKWHHQILWPSKYRSRRHNHYLESFSSKEIVKHVFLLNGGQRVTLTYVSRQIHIAQYIFQFTWRLLFKDLSLNFHLA